MIKILVDCLEGALIGIVLAPIILFVMWLTSDWEQYKELQRLKRERESREYWRWIKEGSKEIEKRSREWELEERRRASITSCRKLPQPVGALIRSRMNETLSLTENFFPTVTICEGDLGVVEEYASETTHNGITCHFARIMLLRQRVAVELFTWAICRDWDVVEAKPEPGGQGARQASVQAKDQSGPASEAREQEAAFRSGQIMSARRASKISNLAGTGAGAGWPLALSRGGIDLPELPGFLSQI